jgi:hypothetical protein
MIDPPQDSGMPILIGAAVFYGVLLGLFLAAVLTAIGWWW